MLPELSDRNSLGRSTRATLDVYAHGIYLVLLRQSERSFPKTLAFTKTSEHEFTLVGELPNFYHATSERLWELRSGKRMFRILNDEVLEKWQEGQAPSSNDYRLNGIFDPVLASLVDEVVLTMGSSSPESFTTHDCFAYDREIRLLGALGPYVFAEQHDYTFGGGAHGGVTSAFRLFDLGEMRVFDEPSELFRGEELPLLAKHHDIAKSILHLRADDLMLGDDTEAELVSISPYIEKDSYGDFDARLTYASAATYVASDGRWASYTISEELKFRGQLTALARYARLPEGLFAALAGRQASVVCWRYLAPTHPGCPTMGERLGEEVDGGPVSGSVLIQHNMVAPWRVPGHGLTDEDLALAVSDELSKTSASQDEAQRRLPNQLKFEFDRVGRQPTNELLERLVELSTNSIAAFFKELAERELGDCDSDNPKETVTTIREEQEEIVITLQCAGLFASGKTDLLPIGKGELYRVATILKELSGYKSISVEGHTDSVGSANANERLSQMRANSVLRCLVDAGVASDRIAAMGKGKSVPIADNKTPEGRAKNRRVEIIVRNI